MECEGLGGPQCDLCSQGVSVRMGMGTTGVHRSPQWAATEPSRAAGRKAGIQGRLPGGSALGLEDRRTGIQPASMQEGPKTKTGCFLGKGARIWSSDSHQLSPTSKRETVGKSTWALGSLTAHFTVGKLRPTCLCPNPARQIRDSCSYHSSGRTGQNLDSGLVMRGP